MRAWARRNDLAGLARIFAGFYMLCAAGAVALPWMVWPIFLLGGWWNALLVVTVPTGLFGFSFAIAMIEDWA